MKDKRLEFYGLLDFYPNKENIRYLFYNLLPDEQRIYKMYVYSLPFEDDYTKDLIWEYLNGWTESQFELARIHRIKRQKMEKRKRIEVHDTEEDGQLEYNNRP